jgi:hypothetical protein
MAEAGHAPSCRGIAVVRKRKDTAINEAMPSTGESVI